MIHQRAVTLFSGSTAANSLFPPPHRGYPAMLGSKVAGAAGLEEEKKQKEAEGMEFGFRRLAAKGNFSYSF